MMAKVFRAGADQRRSHHRHRHTKFYMFTTFCLIAITCTYMFNTNTFISNISVNFSPNSTTPFSPSLFNNQTVIINQLKSTSSVQNPVLIVKEIVIQESKNDHDQHGHVDDAKPAISWLKNKLPEFDILKSNQDFATRADEFLKDCKVRFFMTWISSTPLSFFGKREFLAVEALFHSNHPDSCLMILSNTMDSDHGYQILKPVIDLGFRVQAMEPDLDFLFQNTPAKYWFDHIKNGNNDPGEIPLAQNLSNLIRLVLLYKYGGVYLDTDFITLKDFSPLQNSIGAQSVNPSGNWTRLNNAVMIFDKNHPLVYNFIEEFALTFNGNRWGHNGPYLVSRIVERAQQNMKHANFSVLPPAAFYPVDWRRISGLFRRPVTQAHRRWVEAKVKALKGSSFGVHLWNKQSGRLRIEDGSIMARLISQHCVVCKFFNKSQIFSENDFFIS